MTKKETLKQLLLSTGYFINNDYLDRYLNLVILNAYEGVEYSEMHHILQRAYFKYFNMPIDQTKANKVRLLYKDHCYAHYLLYFCTIGFLKQANFSAIKALWYMNNSLNPNAKVLKEVSPDSFEFLQLRLDEVAEDPDNSWWSKKELAILQEYYPKEGNKVADRLPNRTKYSCYSKALSLGLSHDSSWTEEELNILKKHYQELGASKIAKLLPKRTLDAIRRMAANLGLKNTTRYWSAEELDLLKTYYPIEDTKAFDRILNRSKNECLLKARELGLYSKRYWSPEEIDILIKYYPIEGTDVYKRISKDSTSCRNKASRLGLKKITK